MLAIYAFHTMQCKELWFKTGLKDNVRYIPIHFIAQKLGVSISTALPGGLFQTGKKRAWKVFIISNQSIHDRVGNLGTRVPPSSETFEACEKFICSLYCTSKKAGVVADDVRYWMFCQKHQRSESLPPTSTV